MIKTTILTLFLIAGNASAGGFYSEQPITDPVEAELVKLVRKHEIKDITQVAAIDVIDGKAPAIRITADSEFESEVRAITKGAK